MISSWKKNFSSESELFCQNGNVSHAWCTCEAISTVSHYSSLRQLFQCLIEKKEKKNCKQSKNQSRERGVRKREKRSELSHIKINFRSEPESTDVECCKKSSYSREIFSRRLQNCFSLEMHALMMMMKNIGPITASFVSLSASLSASL